MGTGDSAIPRPDRAGATWLIKRHKQTPLSAVVRGASVHTTLEGVNRGQPGPIDYGVAVATGVPLPALGVAVGMVVGAGVKNV